jgi:hypothetical protein
MSLKWQGKANNFFVQIHFKHAVINSGSGGEWCVTGALLAAVVIPVSQQVSSGYTDQNYDLHSYHNLCALT